MRAGVVPVPDPINTSMYQSAKLGRKDGKLNNERRIQTIS